MSTPAPITPPTPEEIAQAVENVENTASWLVRIVRAIKAAFRKPPTPPAVAALLALALPMLSCSPATMAGVATAVATTGTIIKIVGSVHVPPPPADGQPAARPTPTPVPAATPTPVPTAPTSSPTATPSPAPTAAPTVIPIPTTAPTMPPAPPCAAAPPAPPEPVSVLFAGRCPHGFEPIQYDATARFAPPGTALCAAKSTCDKDGHAACPGVGDKASWAMGYNLNQGQTLQEFAGRTLIYDGGRGCKDAYGRFFHERQNCEVLYTHPDYPDAQWSYTGMAPALECPPATPVPTAAPPSAPPTVGIGCSIPRGDGPGLDCPRTSPRLLAAVTDGVDAVVTLYPEMMEGGGSDLVRAGFEDAFRHAVVEQLRGGGLCAFFDGEEIAVKNSNGFSEQYAVLSSDRRVRRGENTYRATCTPAWSAIPATTEAAAAPAPTAPPVAAPPLLVLVRAGDRCSNPADGNRYLVRHECIVDSTNWYRDPHTPDDVKRDGPCDRDHAFAWATFCHEQSQDDPRGIEINVTGAEWVRDETNPQRAVVTFTPGQEFMVCVRPFADVHNAQGQPIPVLGTAEQCKSQTH